MQIRLRFLLIIILFISVLKSYSQVRINEIMSSNLNAYEDIMYAAFPDWIELHNSGTVAIDLSGYFLSDDNTFPVKWAIPPSTLIQPGEYLVFFADDIDTLNHTNFNLSADSGFISLANNLGLVIDTILYHRQYTNISYGRYPDNSPDLFFFEQSTAGASNNTSLPAIGRVQPPLFSVQPGFYAGNVTVGLFPQNVGDTIYYTLDNSLPDQNSLLYSGPLSISSTTAVHAVSVRSGYINSQMLGGIYLIDIHHGLPVLAILTDSLSLWGTTGIYTNPWSEGEDWEREIQNNYFVNEMLVFDDFAGLRIQGGNSVGMAKKAFREFFRGGYGSTSLDYPWFNYTSVDKFKNIVLRAGYDDQISVYQGTLIRDPLVGEFFRLSGGLSSLSEWAVLYLNNEYWGIYNVRESINEYFIEDHTGYNNFDLIRYTKTGPELKWGDMTDWQYLTNFFNTQNFSLDQTYYDACEFIDMDNFINLLANIHCTQYRSWTWGSFAYKEKSVGGKWRWTLWDADQAIKLTTWNGFSEYQYLSAEKWSNFMPNKLITNAIFKRKLINRTADLLNTLFLPDSASFYVDSTAAIIDSEIDNETARWSSNYAYWASNVNILKSFFNTRPNDLRSQILTYFALPDTQKIILDVVGNGYIHLNTINIEHFPWQGIYFENNTIDIEAIPYPGYMFTGWSDLSLPDTSFITINLTDTFSLTAYFVQDTSYIQPLVINEINYNSIAAYNSDDWVEIYNPNQFSVNLNGWKIQDDNNLNIFGFLPNINIDSGGFLIVCKDTNSFKSVYPGVSDYIGNINFGFGSVTDMVRLFDYENVMIDIVSYSSSYPWPFEANGYGPTLELTYPNLDNSIPQNWVANIGYMGTPGEVNRILSSEYLMNEDGILNVYLYPNPCSEGSELRIYSNKVITDFIVYSADGRSFGINTELMHSENSKYTWKWDGLDFNGNKLSKGVYFIRINTIDGVETLKLLKM